MIELFQRKSVQSAVEEPKLGVSAVVAAAGRVGLGTTTGRMPVPPGTAAVAAVRLGIH